MSPTDPQRRWILVAAFAASLTGAFAAGALAFGQPDEPLVGTFTVVDRSDRYLLAAPHGESDSFTGQMARAICQSTRWTCLIASGFEADGRRINVNRPTEGVRLAETTFSSRAAEVYDAYMGKVRALTPRLQLYVELHGNNHPGSRDNIEIATAGVSEPWAQAIRAILSEALVQNGVGHLTPRIDVLDDIRYAASHNREYGALSMIEPALHVELPENARETHRDAVIAALTEALPRIAEAGAAAPQFAVYVPR